MHNATDAQVARCNTLHERRFREIRDRAICSLEFNLLHFPSFVTQAELTELSSSKSVRFSSLLSSQYTTLRIEFKVTSCQLLVIANGWLTVAACRAVPALCESCAHCACKPCNEELFLEASCSSSISKSFGSTICAAVLFAEGFNKKFGHQNYIRLDQHYGHSKNKRNSEIHFFQQPPSFSLA